MKKMIAAMILGIMLSLSGQIVDLVVNPYSDVNWSTYNQYKANYHTHTTNSDGSQTPAVNIDQYHTKGYKILALTDHDFTTWPWTDYGKDPVALGMLAVRGNEYSRSHHMVALHNFTENRSTLENGIPHVEANGGRSFIAHPGRYNTPSSWLWYYEWYRDYPTCVGMEVYNQGDRYPNDRQLWDNVNENLMKDHGKLVWGYSNDDKHTNSHLYRNYQFMLMPELTTAAHMECMTNGASYFCYESGGSGDGLAPRISQIAVDDVNKTITITATNFTSITWIGPGTANVGSGTTFNYSAYTNQPFVRAILVGSNGRTYTQPFGFTTTTENPPVADFSASTTSAGIGQNVVFTDLSTNNPTSWSWTFNGATPSSSTEKNPSVVYNAEGTYDVSLTATNGFGSDSITKTGYITVTNSTEISVFITSGADDVEEREGDGHIYTNSSDLELVYDTYNNQYHQTVGLRFQNVNIPAGAVITGAYIQFECDETSSGAIDLYIDGHNADNSPAWSGNYDVSSRPRTSNTVSWSPPAWSVVQERGPNQLTPNLSGIVQQIVSRPGWSAGNSMSFIFTNDKANQNKRVAEAYEGGTPAELIVHYSMPSAFPAMTVSKSEINTSAAPEGTDTDSFDIGNAGEEDLTYSITHEYVETKDAKNTVLLNDFDTELGWTNSGGTINWTRDTGTNNLDGTPFARLQSRGSHGGAPTNDTATLTSGIFDGTGYDQLFLDFDQFVNAAADAGNTVTVQYTTDGSVWTTAYTVSGTVLGGWGAPNQQSIELMNNSSTMQLRFTGRFRSKSSDHWALDNVEVRGVTSGPSYTWLTITSPLSGTVIPTEFDTINLTCDAAGLAEGTYNANITIASNDPDEPSRVLPVQFIVAQSTVIPGVPSNVTTSIVGTDLVIDWDIAADATSYDVYSSNDPYGGFAFEANVGTNQYVIPYTDSKKFYYIVSKNATK